MRETHKMVLIHTAGNDGATLADAWIVESHPFPLGIYPREDRDVNLHQSDRAQYTGTAKRHHYDAPNATLGETLAEARALQAVVDAHWAKVKALQPAVETPAERVARKAHESHRTDFLRGWTSGHEQALEAGVEPLTIVLDIAQEVVQEQEREAQDESGDPSEVWPDWEAPRRRSLWQMVGLR